MKQQTSQSSETVQALPLTARSKVIVAACPSYVAADVCSALREAMDALGGIASWVKPGQTVLLKPNLFTAHPPEHVVTTHPEVVRQVILLCAQAGAGKIWVGDSPVGTQDEPRLWSMTGMEAAVKDTPAELKSWRVQQTTISCGEDRLAVPEWYSEVDVIISLPKLKAHCLTTLSCGLKNIYGMVSGPAKLQFHIKYPSPLTMSAFLVSVFSVLKPHLTIADGVMAMEGNGPAHGHPRPVGILLASRDTVALDAVGCRALRIAPETVPMIRVAAEKGLGVMEAAQIEAVGSGVARLQAAHMKPSLSRLLKYIPEPLFKLSVLFWQMRPKILTRECIACGKCVANCPKKTIVVNEKTGYPRVVQKQCIACFCCMESCPKGAIVLQLYLGSLFCVARQRRKGTT